MSYKNDRINCPGIVLIISFVTIMLLLSLTVSEVLASNSSFKTVRDMAGREVKIPAEPDRIIGLGAGSLRMLSYFQEIERVAGVEDIETDEDYYDTPYRIANQEFKDKTVIGPQHGGDAELISGVDPDIILFFGDVSEADRLAASLEAPVVLLDYGDLYNYRDDFYQSIELTGEVLNSNERAEELISFFEETIADLKERSELVELEEAPAVYAGGMSYRGSHGFTSLRTPFPPFEFIRADDVTRDYLDYEAMTQVEISREMILDWDPDYIYLDTGNLPLIRTDFERFPEYRNLTAVRENRVYGLLPYASYNVNFGNVLANSYYIGSKIFSEAFADIDPEDKADDIFKFLFGEAVYAEVENRTGGFGSIDI
ncbi:ABC transporter substrate-binding protein [Halarsenatibacter silvermanii]|uniref:Iron complex transport system substrate-binding protein n=1 Tax=Halarsenatibacter silvermanii TaxID=321763 RepID=A0A1G9S6P8_9FIRM|nr:ABC transporter substrate-binding protein [Halarsenatibacter silvermanii]SDM31061.1 iron complex transport system substrate-binding protein [Halarsenatibacter silvermanii]